MSVSFDPFDTETIRGRIAAFIAGQGVANPLALLMSATMMLKWLADHHDDNDCLKVAEKIKTAYDRSLAEGQKTRDLGGNLSTQEYAKAVIERL